MPLAHSWFSGGNPNNDRLGFRYWNPPNGPFGKYLLDQVKNERLSIFLGFWATLTNALFAYMGTELIGVCNIILTPLHTSLIIITTGYCRRGRESPQKHPHCHKENLLAYPYFLRWRCLCYRPHRSQYRREPVHCNQVEDWSCCQSFRRGHHSGTLTVSILQPLSDSMIGRNQSAAPCYQLCHSYICHECGQL